MNNYEKYINLKQRKKAIDDEMTECLAAIYTDHAALLETKEEGAFKLPVENYKVTITKKLTVSVDQEMAAAVGMAFKPKYSIDKKLFATLNDEQKKSVNECLTTRPAKPQIKIEKL